MSGPFGITGGGGRGASTPVPVSLREPTDDELATLRRFEDDPARVVSPAERAQLRFIANRRGPAAARAAALLRRTAPGGDAA